MPGCPTVLSVRVRLAGLPAVALSRHQFALPGRTCRSAWPSRGWVVVQRQPRPQAADHRGCLDILATCDAAATAKFGPSRKTFLHLVHRQARHRINGRSVFNRIWDQAELPRQAGGQRPRPTISGNTSPTPTSNGWMTQGIDVTRCCPTYRPIWVTRPSNRPTKTTKEESANKGKDVLNLGVSFISRRRRNAQPSLDRRQQFTLGLVEVRLLKFLGRRHREYLPE